jgi:quinol monooxygenase YgiN
MVISTLRIVTGPQSRAEVVRTLVGQLGPTGIQLGCLKCNLYQDVENSEVITLVEERDSQADLDFRLRSEEYRAVLGRSSCRGNNQRFTSTRSSDAGA